MPNYLYECPDTGEIVEVFQHMNDVHEYVKDGIKWQRIFTYPQMSVDTIIDPYSSKDFVNKTNKKGTLGSIWDKSKELSIKRAGNSEDPLQQQFYDNYAKDRNGSKHPDIVKKDAISKLDKMGVIAEVS